MVVKFKHRGNFKNTERLLNNYSTDKILRILNSYGEEGVRALSSATPVDSGVSASSWSYKVEMTKGSILISWTNSEVTKQGTPIVILLQYGHGTGTGGYVQGRDFINPAIAPIMDRIAEAVWKEATSK